MYLCLLLGFNHICYDVFIISFISKRWPDLCKVVAKMWAFWPNCFWKRPYENWNVFHIACLVPFAIKLVNNLSRNESLKTSRKLSFLRFQNKIEAIIEFSLMILNDSESLVFLSNLDAKMYKSLFKKKTPFHKNLGCFIRSESVSFEILILFHWCPRLLVDRFKFFSVPNVSKEVAKFISL